MRDAQQLSSGSEARRCSPTARGGVTADSGVDLVEHQQRGAGNAGVPLVSDAEQRQHHTRELASRRRRREADRSAARHWGRSGTRHCRRRAGRTRLAAGGRRPRTERHPSPTKPSRRRTASASVGAADRRAALSARAIRSNSAEAARLPLGRLERLVRMLELSAPGAAALRVRQHLGERNAVVAANLENSESRSSTSSRRPGSASTPCR